MEGRFRSSACVERESILSFYWRLGSFGNVEGILRSFVSVERRLESFVSAKREAGFFRESRMGG